MTTETMPLEPSPLRRISAVVLAILAAVAVALALSTFWLQRNIFDTDNFVEAAVPLAKDEAVSTAVATRAADAVLASDGAAQIAAALPDELSFLTPVFGGFVHDAVFDATKTVVESDAFSAVWSRILTRAHDRAIDILNGDEPQADIALDLDEAVDSILNALEDAGITLFSNVTVELGELVIVQAEAVALPRALIDVFQTALWLFPLVALLLLGAAVLVDRDRLRPVEIGAFAVAVVMLVSAVALGIVGNSIVGSADTEVGQDAVRAIWDAYAGKYVIASAIVGFVGLAIGVGVWWWRKRVASTESPVTSGS